MDSFMEWYHQYGLDSILAVLIATWFYYIGKWFGYRSMVRQHRLYERKLMAVADLTVERCELIDLYEGEGLSEEQAARLEEIEGLVKSWLETMKEE